MRKHHDIEGLVFEGEKLILKVNGKEYAFRLSSISKKLAAASQAEREKHEISPSGYGIHWPLIDEDISVNGLLNIKDKPKQIRETVAV